MLDVRGALACFSAIVVVGCRDDKRTLPTPPPASASTPVMQLPAAAPAVSVATPSSSPAPSPTDLSPPATLDVDAGAVDVDDASARVAWVRAREATGDLVRMPLVHKGPGWGCICPEHYVGTSPISGGDQTTWIAPVFGPTAPELPAGSVVTVEGYFTGKTSSFTPNADEEFEKATLHEFKVLRHRPVARDPNGEGDGVLAEDARLRTVLAAKDAHRESEAPADGKVFLLVAQSVPMTDGPQAAATAERRRAELVTKGFGGAEVIDSRIAPGLFCCHLVVLASRHATASEAEAAAKDAKKKGVSLIVRRGW